MSPLWRAQRGVFYCGTVGHGWEVPIRGLYREALISNQRVPRLMELEEDSLW